MLAKAAEAKAPIRILGWTYLSLAGLAVLASVYALFQPRGTAASGGLRAMLAEIPGGFRLIAALLAYERPLSLAQLAMGLAVIAAGVAFLRRRAWARTVLEAFTWLSLSGTGIIGLVWFSCWISLARLYAVDAPGFPPVVHLVGIGVGLLLMLLWAAPHLALLKLLRGRAVLAVMNRSS